MSGQTVGNYRIVGTLGVGGMGTVYRAEHVLIGRTTAVKLLNPEMTGNRDVVQRFFNEARATSAIKHPGIVEIFDFGYTENGHAFIVMELLEGEPLMQRMRVRGNLAEAEAAILMRDVCSALSAAHAKGIVHRDLKPDNIFIVPDPELGERTKILDFGIAKLTDIGLASSATKTGSVMGTPTYMSPEQCRGAGTVDHRADLYSIGCMLYEMVAGRPPFTNEGAGELIGSHLFVEPEPLSRHAQVSPELESLVMTLLQKDPARRIQSARELAQHLLAIAQAAGSDVRMSAANMSMPIPSQMLGSGIRHFTPAHHTPSPPAHRTPSPPGHYTPSPPAHYTPAHRTPGPPAHGTPSAAFRPAPQGSPADMDFDAPTVAMTENLFPEKPTTLSGTASESLPVTAPKSRRWAILAGTLVIVLGAGIGGFFALREDAAPTPRHAAPPPPVMPSQAVAPIAIDAAPVEEVVIAIDAAEPIAVPPPIDAAPPVVEAKPKPDKPRKPDKPKPKPDAPKQDPLLEDKL